MGCKSPVIIGTEDITVYQGADLDLLDGVIGYDSNRDEIEVTADPSELDMCDVGEHEVVYSASGIDSSQKDISVCVEPKLHAPNRCKFKTVYATRMVNIEQAPPPTIDGVDGTVINVGASLDLMDGVSATDVNGNEIEVSYSGIYDLKAEGAIASFVTDLKAPLKLLQVSLSPIQDLHGYDSPWVGGAGKNKFPYPYTIASSGTNNGVTYKVNDDGSITLTGTATGIADIALFSPNSYSLDSGTYKISLGGIKDGIKWVYGGSGGALTYNELTHTVADQTINMATSGTCGYCIIRIANGTATNTTLYPMIRLSSVTDASWAPYENISPITAPTTSPNLIPYPYLLGDRSVNGITYTDNGDGTLTIDGTATASAFYDLGDANTNTFELSAGTYTLTGSGNANIGITLCKVVSGSGQFFKNANVNAVTFTTSETATYYLYVVTNSGTSVNNLTIKPQLEKGSHATQFRPYGENVQLIRRGKNLFDGTLQEGYYDVSTGQFVSASGWRATNKIRCKPTTTYVMSGSIYGIGSYNGSALFWDASGNYLGSRGTGANYTSYADADYMAIYLGKSYVTDSMQIEEGTTATPYEPYQSQTYTTSVDEPVYGGTLDLVSGRLVVPVGFGLYDGSEDETWGMETQANDKSFYIARQSDAKPLTDINVSNMLYSTFPFTRNAWEVGSCRLTNGYYNFVVGSVVGATTVDQWRAWLKDNPISYTYELANPQTSQLTPQQINTLLGTNNVWSEQGEVEVIYSKSIDSDEPTFEVGGLYDITYTATDKCGNKTTVTRQIQVGTFRTVLYNDGTLIINEPSDRQAENTAMHGAVRNTYPPLDADHDYVFEPIIDTSGTTAYWDSERGNVTGIIIGSPIRPTDMSYWFMDMTNARFADLTNIDTSNVRFMNNMFNNCSSLTTLDMSNFDTRNVENAFDMLYGCTGLETLNISNWTLNDYLYLAWTNNYSGTVSYIPNVKHFILDNVDTSMMTTMNCMFWGLRYLEELDVSSFDMHNVENMHNMFNGCESLTELDVTNFDTAKVMYMGAMFASCYGLTELVVDNFITDNVYDMQFMFYGIGVTALNLCNFDTSKVEAMRFMFGYSTDLERIYVDPTKFVTTAVTDDGAQMFEGCTSLMGGNGTEYDSSHTNMEYARVDDVGTPGYFKECITEEPIYE